MNPFSKTNKQKKTTNFIISLKQDKLKNALGLLKLRNLKGDSLEMCKKATASCTY